MCQMFRCLFWALTTRGHRLTVGLVLLAFPQDSFSAPKPPSLPILVPDPGSERKVLTNLDGGNSALVIGF